MLTGSSLFDSDKNIMTTFERITKQDIAASLENRVPVASRSLIEGLLQRNPDRRMELKTALAHPWVVSCKEARVQAEPLQVKDSISSSVAKNFLLDLKGQGLDPLNTTSTSTSSGKSPNSTHRDVSFNREGSSINRLDTPTSSVGSRGDMYRSLRDGSGSATIPMKAVPEPEELPCATCSVCGKKMPLDVASIEQHSLLCRPTGGLPPSSPPTTSSLSFSAYSPATGSRELNLRESRSYGRNMKEPSDLRTPGYRTGSAKMNMGEYPPPYR
jgi:serine/threonine protein kinase